MHPWWHAASKSAQTSKPPDMMTSDNIKGTIMLAGVAAAAMIAWKIYSSAKGTADSIGSAAAYVAEQASAAAETVGHWVNPADDQNLAYSSISTVGGAVMSQGGPNVAGMNADGSWNLGAYAYDMTHRDAITGNYAWWPYGNTPENTGGATGRW